MRKGPGVRVLCFLLVLVLMLPLFSTVRASASSMFAHSWINDEARSGVYYDGRGVINGGTVSVTRRRGYSSGDLVEWQEEVPVTDAAAVQLFADFANWVDTNLNVYVRYSAGNSRTSGGNAREVKYWAGGSQMGSAGTYSVSLSESKNPNYWMSNDVNDALYTYMHIFKQVNEARKDWNAAVEVFNGTKKNEDDYKTLKDAGEAALKKAFDYSGTNDSIALLGSEYYNREIALGEVSKTLKKCCDNNTALYTSDRLSYAQAANAGVRYFDFLTEPYSAEKAIKCVDELAMYIVTFRETIQSSINVSIMNGARGDEQEDPGSVERGFSDFLRGIAESLQVRLYDYGLSLDTIIYGRVDIRGTAVPRNDYAFELVEGNIYGLVGSAVYSVLRGLLLLGMVLVVLFQLVKGSFARSARSYDMIKENLLYSIIAVGLMVFMPNIVDLLIFIRDWMLSIIGPVVRSITSGNRSVFSDLAGRFRSNIVEPNGIPTFVGACEYLGIVVLTVYFAFVYVSMACSMTILFAFFPLFVLMSFKNRKLLDDWFMFCLGVLVTPIIDAMLFTLPLLANSTKLDVPDLVQFMLCMSLIPARATVRSMLGLGRSVGAEMVGMGALLAAGHAVGGLIRATKNVVGTAAGAISSIKSDRDEANTLEDLAKTEDAVHRDRLDKFDRATEESATILGDRAMDGSFSHDDADNYGVEDFADGLDGRRSAGLGSGRSIIPNYGADFNAKLDPSTDLKTQRQKVLDKHASVGNLDSPLMKDMSASRRAELLKERAVRTGIKGGLQTLGMVGGGVGGATIGFGATTFMSPQARIMTTAGGAIVGSELGSAAGAGAYSLGSGGIGMIKAGAGKISALSARFGGGIGDPNGPLPLPSGAGVGDNDNPPPPPDGESYLGYGLDYNFVGEDIPGNLELFVPGESYTDAELEAELSSLSNDTFSRDKTTAWLNLQDGAYVSRAEQILSKCRLSGNEAQFARAVEGVGDIVNRNSGLMAGGYTQRITNSCKMGQAIYTEVNNAAGMAERYWSRDASGAVVRGAVMGGIGAYMNNAHSGSGKYSTYSTVTNAGPGSGGGMWTAQTHDIPEYKYMDCVRTENRRIDMANDKYSAVAYSSDLGAKSAAERNQSVQRAAGGAPVYAASQHVSSMSATGARGIFLAEQSAHPGLELVPEIPAFGTTQYVNEIANGYSGLQNAPEEALRGIYTSDHTMSAADCGPGIIKAWEESGINELLEKGEYMMSDMFDTDTEAGKAYLHTIHKGLQYDCTSSGVDLSTEEGLKAFNEMMPVATRWANDLLPDLLFSGDEG